MSRILTAKQFDILDHLHTHDAHLYPIERADLATTLRVDDDSVDKRMRRLAKHGLAIIHKPTHRDDPFRYSPSELGTRLWRAQLLAWDGVVAPPTQDESVAHASLAVFGLTHYGTEAAA
jgi:DNA-binding MarR family transcriptional regulator